MHFYNYILNKYWLYFFLVVATYVALYLIYHWISSPLISLTSYGLPFAISVLSLLYLSYFVFRVMHSWIWFRKIHALSGAVIETNVESKKVGVVIPSFNEHKENITLMLRSLLLQSHENTYLYIIDDGSTQRDDIAEVVSHLNSDKIVFQRLTTNKGKRNAMYVAYQDMKDHEIDYMVTVDSDTTVDEHGIEILVKTIESDQRYGSVTGQVLSKNVTQRSLFQKMIAMRYLYAFNVERASQSNYGAVQCNSGPLSIYRMALLDDIMEKFISQQFLGQPATFGDDRHLTNRVLEKGYRCIYQPYALAFTDTPPDMRSYWRQQLRWSKSYIRESFWQLKTFRKHSVFVLYDYLIGITLPFFLFFSVVSTIVAPFITTFAAHGDHGVFANSSISFFLSTVVVVALLKGVYLKILTSKQYVSTLPGYGNIARYVIFFGLCYIVCLVYLKPLAFVTPNKTGWGTRG